MAMASSISPPASASSAVFSVSSSALPDHLDLGMGMGVGGGPYSFASNPTSISTPSLPLPIASGALLTAQPEQGYNHARSYESSYPPPHLASHPFTSETGMFSGESNVSNSAVVGLPSSSSNTALPQSMPLARNNTATQQSYTNAMQFNGADAPSLSLPFANAATGLDASLTVGLSLQQENNSASQLDNHHRS